MAATALGSVLRVVGPGQLDAAMKARDEEVAAAEDAAAAGNQDLSSVASYIRGQFDMFRRHRNNAMAGWSDRLLNALRAQVTALTRQNDAIIQLLADKFDSTAGT